MLVTPAIVTIRPFPLTSVTAKPLVANNANAPPSPVPMNFRRVAGHLHAARRSPRNGVSVQLEPAERRHFARPVRVHPGRHPAPLRTRVQEPAANAARQCALPLCGARPCRRTEVSPRNAESAQELTCAGQWPFLGENLHRCGNLHAGTFRKKSSGRPARAAESERHALDAAQKAELRNPADHRDQRWSRPSNIQKASQLRRLARFLETGVFFSRPRGGHDQRPPGAPGARSGCHKLPRGN